MRQRSAYTYKSPIDTGLFCRDVGLFCRSVGLLQHCRGRYSVFKCHCETEICLYMQKPYRYRALLPRYRARMPRYRSLLRGIFLAEVLALSPKYSALITVSRQVLGLQKSR